MLLVELDLVLGGLWRRLLFRVELSVCILVLALHTVVSVSVSGLVLEDGLDRQVVLRWSDLLRTPIFLLLLEDLGEV